MDVRDLRAAVGLVSEETHVLQTDCAELTGKRDKLPERMRPESSQPTESAEQRVLALKQELAFEEELHAYLEEQRAKLLQRVALLRTAMGKEEDPEEFRREAEKIEKKKRKLAEQIKNTENRRKEEAKEWEEEKARLVGKLDCLQEDMQEFRCMWNGVRRELLRDLVKTKEEIEKRAKMGPWQRFLALFRRKQV